VTFRNGPEAPRVRRVNVPAGKSADVTAKFNRDHQTAHPGGLQSGIKRLIDRLVPLFTLFYR
jgi:hypothetical protein